MTKISIHDFFENHYRPLYNNWIDKLNLKWNVPNWQNYMMDPRGFDEAIIEHSYNCCKKVFNTPDFITDLDKLTNTHDVTYKIHDSMDIEFDITHRQ